MACECTSRSTTRSPGRCPPAAGWWRATPWSTSAWRWTWSSSSPLYAASALLLWRGSPWGHVLGAVSVVAGVLHQVSYLVAMPVQVAAEVSGAVSYDAAEPVIVALYLLGAALLFGQPTHRTRTGLGRTR